MRTPVGTILLTLPATVPLRGQRRVLLEGIGSRLLTVLLRWQGYWPLPVSLARLPPPPQGAVLCHRLHRTAPLPGATCGQRGAEPMPAARATWHPEPQRGIPLLHLNALRPGESSIPPDTWRPSVAQRARSEERRV